MKAREILSTQNGLLLVVTCASFLLASRYSHARASNRTLTVDPTTMRALTSSGHVIGSSVATVRIIEFADYECPYCASLAPQLDAILQKYAGSVSLLYHQFPLPSHPNAVPAALAAECAADQGRFANMHAELYARHAVFTSTPWLEMARAAGVSDSTLFMQCLKNPETEVRVKHDARLGSLLDVKGTPTLVIQNQRFIAVPSRAQIETAIERALAHQ